jgi:MFS family permease
MSCLIFFTLGMFFLGSSYAFAVAPYTQCPSPHAGALCPQYACTLPLSQRNQYRDPQIAQLKTLGNAFGDYSCGSLNVILFLKGVPWVGAIFGTIIASTLADNFGRRPTLLLFLTINSLGYGIILLSHTIVMVGVGLFITGFGHIGYYCVVFSIISDILDNEWRQRVELFLQSLICSGGLFTVLAFYLIKDWKTIYFTFQFLPLVGCLIFAYFYLQETQQSLIQLHTV